LFQSGRSQVVRLPEDYRFQGSAVAVKHFGNGVLCWRSMPLGRRWKRALAPSSRVLCWSVNCPSNTPHALWTACVCWGPQILGPLLQGLMTEAPTDPQSPHPWSR